MKNQFYGPGHRSFFTVITPLQLIFVSSFSLIYQLVPDSAISKRELKTKNFFLKITQWR